MEKKKSIKKRSRSNSPRRNRPYGPSSQSTERHSFRHKMPARPQVTSASRGKKRHSMMVAATPMGFRAKMVATCARFRLTFSANAPMANPSRENNFLVANCPSCSIHYLVHKTLPLIENIYKKRRPIPRSHFESMSFSSCSLILSRNLPSSEMTLILGLNRATLKRRQYLLIILRHIL